MATFREFEHQGWQQVATRYHDAFASVTTQSVEALLDGVETHKGTRLLDLACGPGYVSEAAGRRGAQPLGIDFSSEMLNEARRRYPEFEFQEGDAEQLVLPDNEFDAVTMNYGMLHLGQPERAMAEAYRVLRNGGRFAFTVWDVPENAMAFGIVLQSVQAHGDLNVPIPPGPPFFRFSNETESRQALSDAGFVDVKVTRVPQLMRLDSSDDLFGLMYNASVRSAALLHGQKSEVLELIRTAIRAGVERYRKGDVFELPMPAVLSSAQKKETGAPKALGLVGGWRI